MQVTLEIACMYDREGADELCFLDITASHENREIILDVVAHRRSSFHAAYGGRRNQQG
jgi:imidazole glycerol phosphate synthase subunit HisF